MTARDDAELVEAVAGVLGEHRWKGAGPHGDCTCGWVANRRAPIGVGEQHRAHLAAALLPLIREREAAAWDLGYYRGVRDGTEDTDAAANPYAGSEGDDE